MRESINFYTIGAVAGFVKSVPLYASFDDTLNPFIQRPYPGIASASLTLLTEANPSALGLGGRRRHGAPEPDRHEGHPSLPQGAKWL